MPGQRQGSLLHSAHWRCVCRLTSRSVPLLLLCADVCAQAGVHVTYFGTGCIFTYDDKHPLGSGVGFKDDDPPNFTGSFYSKVSMMMWVMLMYAKCMSE